MNYVRTKNFIDQDENLKEKIRVFDHHVSGIDLNSFSDIDFAIIINVSRSVSYRGCDKVDLNLFASKYGGGGHKNAAGMRLPDHFLEDVTKLIFENIQFLEEK